MRPRALSFQTLISFLLPETTNSPFELIAMQQTLSWCPVNVESKFPVAVSQIRTVLSSLAETIWEPVGMNNTALTSPVWPRSVLISSPVSVFQSRRVLSQLAETI